MKLKKDICMVGELPTFNSTQASGGRVAQH